MMHQRRILVGLVILLIAAFLRLWLFGEVPPGLQHDEIFKAEEGVRLIQDGDFRLFYPSNQGHEGAFVWLLGISHLLTGINPLMVRFPAFICGILTVALIFRFGYRAYTPQVGILASGLTAVSFWAVFTSRVGLRAVMLPLMVLLVLIGLHSILSSTRSKTRWGHAIYTGLALGFGVYTYTSSFVLYLIFVLFLPVLLLIRRDIFIRYWKELIVVAALGTVLVLPMVYIRITDPQGDNRVKSITTPLQEAQAGNPQSLFNNGFKLAGMPAFVGDPTWRYNVAGRPLFLLPIGLLVYVGFFLVLTQIRHHPLNFMLLGLALFGLIPSLLTVLAPSFLRSIVALPSIMLFIGIAVWTIGQFFHAHKWISWGLIAGVVTITGIADYRAYFIDWMTSQNPILSYHDEMEQGATVFEIYRDDLEQLAHYLQKQDESLVFVSTPDSGLDPLLYKFSGALPQDKTHVVFFDAFANIVLSQEPVLLFVSPLSPISDKHAHWLKETYGTAHVDQIYRQDGAIAFDVYRLNDTKEALSQKLEEIASRTVYLSTGGEQKAIEFPINFGDLMLFRGAQIPRATVYGENDGVNNQLYFEPVVKSSGATLNVFLHVINDKQEVVAQRDLLGVPPAYWHPGIIFIQDNFVPFWEPVPAGTYQLVMGVYDWQTGDRLPILNKSGEPRGDQLILAEIEVLEPEK